MNTPPIADISEYIDSNSDWIAAISVFVLTLVVAKVADFLIARNAKRVNAMSADGLSQSAVTRLRLARRLVVAAILVVGIGVAVFQLDVFRPLGTTLLASSAVVGVAVGIAARATLANALAGIVLASAQPFRVGDVIEWDGRRGRVEDITLSYTTIRLPSANQLIVPNEVIAQSPVENFTIAGSTVDASASVRVRPAYAAEALDLLREKLEGTKVNLGECMADSVELKLGFTADAADEPISQFAKREEAIAILSRAGMLEAAPGQ